MSAETLSEESIPKRNFELFSTFEKQLKNKDNEFELYDNNQINRFIKRFLNVQQIPNVPRAARNTLIHLWHTFRNANIDFYVGFSEDTAVLKIVGVSITNCLIKKTNEANELLNTFYTSAENQIEAIPFYTSSIPFVRELAARYSANMKKFFNIPQPEERIATSLSPFLNSYRDIYRHITIFDLKKDIVDCIIDYLKSERFLQSHRITEIPTFMQSSIIPDLQALGLDDVIPELSDQLIQKFGNNFTSSERFAIEYPIKRDSSLVTHQYPVPHNHPPS